MRLGGSRLENDFASRITTGNPLIYTFTTVADGSTNSFTITVQIDVGFLGIDVTNLVTLDYSRNPGGPPPPVTS